MHAHRRLDPLPRRRRRRPRKPPPRPLWTTWPHLHIRTASQRRLPGQHGHAPVPTHRLAGLLVLSPPPKLSNTPREPHLYARAPAKPSLRSLQTAMPAQARDHLQRMRSPHELSFTTRPQGGTRPKSEAPGGAQKHQDGPDHPGYPPAHTAPNPTKSTYRHAPLHAGQIVQLRHHHADTVGNGDGLKGRTRCSPAKFVLVPQPHRISPQPAITATRPRRP